MSTKIPDGYEEIDGMIIKKGAGTFKKGQNTLSEEDLKPSSDTKVRITTFIDADVLTKLKALAKQEGTGYQTLLNQYLRAVIMEKGLTQDQKAAVKDLDSLIEGLQILKGSIENAPDGFKWKSG